MNIKIYNSLTNQIEDFHPVKPQEISIYVCGPTVYNDIHIGNARPVVFFDTVARFFKYLGYNVRMVSNFTDIDDKIIMRAKELGISETEVAKHYIDEFLRINNLLGAESLLARPRVTEYMEAIINYIKVMLDKGVAYQSGTDVYFRISSVPDYGLLSNQKMEDLKSVRASKSIRPKKIRAILCFETNRRRVSCGTVRSVKAVRVGIPSAW